MKNFVLMVGLFLLFVCQQVNAMSFEEAFAKSNSKPMVVLIYAQWADGYQTCLTQFKALQAQFKHQYNFVELDIASKDAKMFNSRYDIYQNLPYIMVYRNGGKISRYIKRDCATNYSCTVSRLKSFIQ